MEDYKKLFLSEKEIKFKKFKTKLIINGVYKDNYINKNKYKKNSKKKKNKNKNKIISI